MKKKRTKPALEAGKLCRTTTISLSETEMAFLDELVAAWEAKSRSAVVRTLLEMVKRKGRKK